MQRIWSADELGEFWSLLPEDLALLAGRVDAGKLGFAVHLVFWRQHGRFPDDEADVAPAVIAHLAAQIGVSVEALYGYAWAGRSGRRHRVAIIDHLAVAAFDEAAEGRFRRWLADDVLPREFGASVLRRRDSSSGNSWKNIDRSAPVTKINASDMAVAADIVRWSRSSGVIATIP
jgi:hypothetical protein